MRHGRKRVLLHRRAQQNKKFELKWLQPPADLTRKPTFGNPSSDETIQEVVGGGIICCLLWCVLESLWAGANVLLFYVA